MPNKLVAASISVVAGTLALLHIAYPALGIDAITVALFLLGALPWLLPFLKSLELPGGVKIELKDAIAATARIGATPLAAPSEATTTKSVDAIKSLQPVVTQDPNLALVAVRIEIEKRLLRIAENHNIDAGRKSINRVIRNLQERGVLTAEVAGGLVDLVQLGNRAAHGVEVSPDASAWVLKVAPSILDQLDKAG